MVTTLTNLNVTENYADDTRLTQAQLNTAMASIETSVNTFGYRNIEQLARDCFPDARYELDEDGVANNVNSLYDKQSVTDTYNGGDIAIGTSADAAYAAVDAVNAAITITPMIRGKFLAVFHFTHRVTSTANAVLNIDVSFRLTDGTTASMAANSGGVIAAIAADNGELYHAVTLSQEFNWTDELAHTVTLQKFVRVATNVSTDVVAAAAATGEINMEVHKI
jgi:hypothetical protein